MKMPNKPDQSKTITTFAALFLTAWIVCANLLLAADDKAIDLSQRSFEIQTGKSQVGFSVQYLGLSDIQGEFRKFNGNIDTQNGKITSIKGNILTESVQFADKSLNELVRSMPFLHAEKFPNITFASTHVEYQNKDIVVRGILCIKHEKHEITLRGTHGGIAHENADDSLLTGIDLKGDILRAHFGILMNDLNPDGRKIVGDKVNLQLHLLAKTDPRARRVTTSTTKLLD